jgi:uncharacterized protein YndB with AHSA1/START domain
MAFEAQGRAAGDGYDLAVERFVDAAPAAVFDAFLGMYGDDRPDWITGSRLDLRPGGAWLVAFHPPGLPPFREERVITEVDRPRRLAYTVTAIPAGLRTSVTLSFGQEGGRTHVVLTQTGFPDAATRDEFAGAWPDVLALLRDRAEAGLGEAAGRP